MTDAPLQAAAAPLRVKEIYEVFVALCVDTVGVFEAACAAAAVRGFEPFDLASAPSPDTAQLLAEARFRRPGYFFTASKFLAAPAGKPSRRVQNLSLVARPAGFRDLAAAIMADLGTPTGTNKTPGLEFVLLGDPTTTKPFKSQADAEARFERREGDLFLINAWEVRADPAQPGDAVALSMQRWTL